MCIRDSYGGDLRKVVEMIIDKAGLIRALQDEGTDEARGRIENIQEFLGVVDEFVQTHDAEESDFAAPTVGEDESAEPVRCLLYTSWDSNRKALCVAEARRAAGAPVGELS